MAITLRDYGASVGHNWKLKQLPGNRRYGVEIELGFNAEDDLDRFFSRLEEKKLEPYLIAKSDGSIVAANCAEVVTRPLCYLEARRVAKRVLDCALEQETLNLRGCGVHVHVTRSAWSQRALLYAHAAICNRPRSPFRIEPNSPQGRTIKAVSEFWTALATRPENDYCTRTRFRDDFATYATEREAFHAWSAYANHYSAVSYSLHEPTIEFRLFGPTRQSRTLASYLDTVDALLRYGDLRTKDQPWGAPSLFEFNPVEFAKWVKDQPGYQALKWRLTHGSQLKRALQNYRSLMRDLAREAQNGGTQESPQSATPQAAETQESPCGVYPSETCRQIPIPEGCPCIRPRGHDGQHYSDGHGEFLTDAEAAQSRNAQSDTLEEVPF